MLMSLLASCVLCSFVISASSSDTSTYSLFAEFVISCYLPFNPYTCVVCFPVRCTTFVLHMRLVQYPQCTSSRAPIWTNISIVHPCIHFSHKSSEMSIPSTQASQLHLKPSGLNSSCRSSVLPTAVKYEIVISLPVSIAQLVFRIMLPLSDTLQLQFGRQEWLK